MLAVVFTLNEQQKKNEQDKNNDLLELFNSRIDLFINSLYVIVENEFTYNKYFDNYWKKVEYELDTITNIIDNRTPETLKKLNGYCEDDHLIKISYEINYILLIKERLEKSQQNTDLWNTIPTKWFTYAGFYFSWSSLHLNKPNKDENNQLIKYFREKTKIILNTEQILYKIPSQIPNIQIRNKDNNQLELNKKNFEILGIIIELKGKKSIKIVELRIEFSSDYSIIESILKTQSMNDLENEGFFWSKEIISETNESTISENNSPRKKKVKQGEEKYEGQDYSNETTEKVKYIITQTCKKELEGKLKEYYISELFDKHISNLFFNLFTQMQESMSIETHFQFDFYYENDFKWTYTGKLGLSMFEDKKISIIIKD